MNLRILSASAAVVALSLVSCSKMNDLHKPYLEKGETVYAAKVDSVKAFVGVNSQVLDILFRPTGSVVVLSDGISARIRWSSVFRRHWCHLSELLSLGLRRETIPTTS